MNTDKLKKIVSSSDDSDAAVDFIPLMEPSLVGYI